MKLGFLIIIAFITNVTCSGQDSMYYSDSCKSKFNSIDLNNYSLQELGREYQRLRRLKSKDCDKFGSDLHHIMSVLGDSIGKARFSRNETENIMGRPDSDDKTQVANYVRLDYNEQIMVYFWRGWHDFLYIVINDGKVIRSGWWFAYE